MQRLYLKQTTLTPEIIFSPDENIFTICGRSSPEDVRAMYYPVIEWVKVFVNDILEKEGKIYSSENPLSLKIDLEYFNSSSAKFLFDILSELKKVIAFKVPVIVEWIYDIEDLDQKEAGSDFASLVEMEFVFVPKKK
jgi:hypothetical protein